MSKCLDKTNLSKASNWLDIKQNNLKEKKDFHEVNFRRFADEVEDIVSEIRYY